MGATLAHARVLTHEESMCKALLDICLLESNILGRCPPPQWDGLSVLVHRPEPDVKSEDCNSCVAAKAEISRCFRVSC